MSKYQSKFICGNKKCNGELIPIQITENKKDNTAHVLGKCLECKKTYEFPLSLDKADIDDWLPILQEHMFKCTECGQTTLKTEKVSGSPKSEYKIKFDCIECQKQSERYVDGGLFFLVSDKLPSAERTIITCPTCGQKITDESKKKCPNCGRDIFCSKCGSLIEINQGSSKFCAKCGEPVQLGTLTKKSISAVSPPAGIVCSTCGNHLPPGAVFCNMCGTAVKSGQKITKPSKPLDTPMGREKR
ncbi:MAG TPA: zinc-ribbon domain-containing protein [Candidatus Lokiarchaeia archaeon]|nr:zinc-ribbon domain-containing protein [Candidatus Lokiarchaeia archaeon]